MFFPKCINLSSLLRARIVLWNLADREVADIGVGGKVGLEGCADFAKLVPGHATEEGVGFDLLGTVLTVLRAEAVLYVTEHTAEPMFSNWT